MIDELGLEEETIDEDGLDEEVDVVVDEARWVVLGGTEVDGACDEVGDRVVVVRSVTAVVDGGAENAGCEDAKAHQVAGLNWPKTDIPAAVDDCGGSDDAEAVSPPSFPLSFPKRPPKPPWRARSNLCSDKRLSMVFCGKERP